MAIKNEFMPKYAIHPGRMLLEEIRARHMTQVEFAERTGITSKHLSDIINGKADITPDIAIQIESATGTPASLWLNLQMQYEEVLARQRKASSLQNDLKVINLFPYSKIRKIWPSLLDTRDPFEKISALCQLFCVSSISLLVENINNERFTIRSPAFRTSGKTNAHEVDRFALAAWIQVGKLQAARERLYVNYNQANLRKFANSIPSLSAYSNIPTAWNEIKKGLNECGVKIILVPYLPKTYINGAIYWEDDTPVIILNAKTSYWDTMIFTLLHEIGHILLHGKTYTSISFDQSHTQLLSSNSKEENEADLYSLNTLINQSEFDRFIDNYLNGNESIRHFASEYHVDCGIVASRIATNNMMSWAQCRQFRRQVQISV